MTDAETEIAQLKAKVQAIETVHAVLIGALAIMTNALAGAAAAFVKDAEPAPFFTPEKLLQGVRDSIRTSASSADAALAERMTLLSEQYIEDAIHVVEHCMKTLDRPNTGT